MLGSKYTSVSSPLYAPGRNSVIDGITTSRKKWGRTDMGALTPPPSISSKATLPSGNRRYILNDNGSSPGGSCGSRLRILRVNGSIDSKRSQRCAGRTDVLGQTERTLCHIRCRHNVISGRIVGPYRENVSGDSIEHFLHGHIRPYEDSARWNRAHLFVPRRQLRIREHYRERNVGNLLLTYISRRLSTKEVLCHDITSLRVSRGCKEARNNSPLLQCSGGHWMLLEHLGYTVGHLDAGTTHETIVVLFSKRWLRHLAPTENGRLLSTEEHRLHTSTCSPCCQQRGPNVGDEARNLRHLPHNHAVVDLIPILEDRVIIHASALAGTSILVHGLQINLQIPEWIRPCECHIILVSVPRLERSNTWVSQLGHTFAQADIGRLHSTVCGSNVRQRAGMVASYLIGDLLSKEDTITVVSLPLVLLGSRCEVVLDTVDPHSTRRRW